VALRDARPRIAVADPPDAGSGKGKTGHIALLHGQNGGAAIVERSVIREPGPRELDRRIILLIAHRGCDGAARTRSRSRSRCRRRWRRSGWAADYDQVDVAVL